MVELSKDKLDSSIKYLEDLINGKNPVTGEVLSSESVFNNLETVRCMFFVRDVLEKIKTNNYTIQTGTTEKLTLLPPEIVSNYSYEGNKSVTAFVKQINTLYDTEKYGKLSFEPIQNWLRENGYLEKRIDDVSGNMVSLPTPKGESIGLIVEKRETRYNIPYSLVVFTQDAQLLIIEHLREIIEGTNPWQESS